MTGWCRSLDGEDVYVQDDGWVWSEVQRGWFYAPDLLVAPPTPPASVQARTTYRDLSTGWPPLRRIFDICHPLHATGQRITQSLILGGVTAMWVWIISLGPTHTLRALQQEIYAQWLTIAHGTGGEPGAWYFHDDPDRAAHALVWTYVALVITFGMFYSIYVGAAWAVDPHKGAMLLTAQMAHSAWRLHQRNERRHEQRFAADVARELDRRHGYPH